MTHETMTSLSPSDVLTRAKMFFAERIPHSSAFVEHEGDHFCTFRGQGGEELVLAVAERDGRTLVRGSTLLFDQAIGRFFSTLPTVEAGTA
jgi:hypothetical protein